MSDIIECQDLLLQLAKKQGFLTFDNIIDASDTFSLSIAEVDQLSEAIQLRGVIVYETNPLSSRSGEVDEDELDYSRTNYDLIYTELLKLAPQLKPLIDQVKRFPTPRYGETNHLATQIAEGNTFARERMIILYIRNVFKIALSMAKQFELEIEDAISSGFEGLVSAVDRYDPTGFSNFHSYASRWIQQRIQRDCNPTWALYSYPAQIKVKMFIALQKYKAQTNGEDIGSQLYYELVSRIAGQIELSETDIDKAIQYEYKQKYERIRVDDVVFSEDNVKDNLPAEFIENEEKVFFPVYQKESMSFIESLLCKLSDREKMIIEMRNGIGHEMPMTLEDIGNRLNLTRERVRQIEAKALNKLRKQLSREAIT